ncbi:MAG: hypothetical protein ACXVA9_06095, partial [Bdellovibrionales bacterium]
SAPNMIMIDAGQSLGDLHYINIDFMGTIEKWTVPHDGNPELLQIGEHQADGSPFLDAQHPHSSPIMGLTLSDTISLGHDKDNVKIWFSPRGQATDGPVPFMHRPTGMVNPDTPLGHHIGQDVGHITSTVIGSSLKLSDVTLELSTFNGTEPEPTKVDLPLRNPNSYAARLIGQFTAQTFAMVSAAYVKSPEPDDSTLDHIWRYSASLYRDDMLRNGWMLHRTLIWGLVNQYDHASALNSFAHEAWLHKEAHSIWTRLEFVQRTPAELEITTASEPNRGRYVTALTLGYTHKLGTWDVFDVGLGGSLTKDFLPSEYRTAYGGNPLSGKIFLQLSGMKMWEL